MKYTSANQLDKFSVNQVLRKLDIEPHSVWVTGDDGKRKLIYQATDSKGETITFRDIKHKKAYAFDGYVNRFRCFPSV